MILGQATTCAKTILLGEHFVVYGVPALAAPVFALNTQVQVIERSFGEPELRSEIPEEHRATAQRMLIKALELVGAPPDASWLVEVSSTLPTGYGVGSSAALSVGLVRALAQACGRTLTTDEVDALSYELERIVHGTPSGIDNAVVSRRSSVLHQLGLGPQAISPGAPFQLVLASSGVPGSTKDAVAAVRALRAAEGQHFESQIEAARLWVEQGRAAFVKGDAGGLGEAMSALHLLLREIGVATPMLNRLVETALSSGAMGAKLTGSGYGGFIIALVNHESSAAVVSALRAAGAPLVFTTEVKT